MAEKAISDIGGEPAGPLELDDHQPTLTERRIDAMMMLLRRKPRSFWTTDENRRTIESLAPEFYEGDVYYERWVRAMRGLLVEKGLLTEAEIGEKINQVRQRLAREQSS